MREAGVEGHFTNHSLRATTATRMFQKGVDEQLIKRVTGHKSDAVRLYKRTSESLVNAACKTVVERDSDMSSCLKKQNVESNNESVESDLKKESVEFDIDKYEISEDDKVSYRTHETDGGGRCHKLKCSLVDSEGKCGGLCKVLKKLDEKAAEIKVKKVRLSLKLKK